MNTEKQSSEIKEQVAPPPVIINNNDGFIAVSDSEPLDADPDPFWKHKINCNISITRVFNGADNTFKATVTAESETSKSLQRFEFDAENDVLEIELDETAPDISQIFSPGPLIFKAINNAATLTVNIAKKKKKVGRTVHTISYSNIKEGVNE